MATQSTSAGGLDSTLGSDTEVSASSDPLRPSERQLRTERRRNIAAQFEGAAGASKHRTGTPHFWSVFAAKPTRAPVPSEADLRMGPHQKDREDPEVLQEEIESLESTLQELSTQLEQRRETATEVRAELTEARRVRDEFRRLTRLTVQMDGVFRDSVARSSAANPSPRDRLPLWTEVCARQEKLETLQAALAWRHEEASQLSARLAMSTVGFKQLELELRMQQCRSVADIPHPAGVLWTQMGSREEGEDEDEGRRAFPERSQDEEEEEVEDEELLAPPLSPASSGPMLPPPPLSPGGGPMGAGFGMPPTPGPGGLPPIPDGDNFGNEDAEEDDDGEDKDEEEEEEEDQEEEEGEAPTMEVTQDGLMNAQDLSAGIFLDGGTSVDSEARSPRPRNLRDDLAESTPSQNESLNPADEYPSILPETPEAPHPDDEWIDSEVAAILARRNSVESVGETPAKENDVSSARSVGATRGSTLSTTLSKDVSTPPSEPRFETPTPPEATAAVDLESAAPILSAFVGVLTQIKERAVPTAFAMLKAGQGLHLAAAFIIAEVKRHSAQAELKRRVRASALARAVERRRARVRAADLAQSMALLKAQVGLHWAAATIQERWHAFVAGRNCRDELARAAARWAAPAEPRAAGPVGWDDPVGGSRGLLKTRQSRPVSAPAVKGFPVPPPFGRADEAGDTPPSRSGSSREDLQGFEGSGPQGYPQSRSGSSEVPPGFAEAGLRPPAPLGPPPRTIGPPPPGILGQDLAERTEYLPLFNTLSETDALTRKVERSLAGLRELLATPRRLERLDAAPPLPMEIGARSHELPMEIAEPRVRPVSGPAGGALRHAASTPALPRPASAVPATGFRRPPNVPAVRLPGATSGTAQPQRDHESDLDGSSMASSHSVGSLTPGAPGAGGGTPGVPSSPARREYERSSGAPSGRSRSGRGTRSNGQSNSSRALELRTELVALCQWLLRKYRSSLEACSVLIGGPRTPLDQFAKALVQEGYSGRPTLAARAVDWRARGVVRSADLQALLDTDSDSTSRSSHSDNGGHVQAFFTKHKNGTATRPEPRPFSAPTQNMR